MQDYLIIASNEAQIEHYQRQKGEKWVIQTRIGLNSQLELPSLGLTLLFQQIYELVEFETE